MKKLFAITTLFVCSIAAPAALANTATLVLSAGQANESWSSSATNSGILTLSFGTLGTITLTGYSCPDTLCATTATQSESILADGLTDNSGALGVATNTSGGEKQIPRNDFVTIDFSGFKGNISSVTINMTDVVDGWDIYSTGIANEFDSTGGNPLAQGNNGVGVSLGSYPTSANSSITSPVNGVSTGHSTFDPTTNYVTVSALQADCETEISSISITYNNTPEPGSCVLMGGALLSLGLAGKKLRRRP